MTISSETRKAGPFLGTGAVSEYPFDFTVFSAGDLLVVMADQNGAESILVLDSDYTVELNADQDASPGGTVVLTDPLPDDYLLVITSDIEALQPTDLTNQGGFYPEVVNASLDRLTILIQQLRENVSRSLKVSITSSDEATPDAIIAQMAAAVGSASASATAAAGSALTASGAATAAAGSAIAAAESASDAASVVTDFIASGLTSHRNRLVNGNFTVNQLVKSGTVTLAAGEYGHDCWKGGASGCTYTFASSGGITTLTITAGSLINVVEGAFLQTGTHTLSWTGTAQGKIGAGSYSASGVTGAATAGTNLSIEFNTGTLSLVQFEPGSIPTPFEHRDGQLQRCQRYCWKTYAQGTAPGTATQTGTRGCSNTANAAYGATMTLAFPVEMAASPTITFYNPITGAAGTWRAVSTDYAMGTASITPSTNGALIGNSAAIATAGQILFGHVLVEARL